MKVSIEHGEKAEGFIRKTTYYTVTTTVEFSEEEKAIMAKSKLDKKVLMNRPIPANQNPAKFKGMEDVFDLSMYKLLKGPDVYFFDNVADAKAYEEELKEALGNLKRAITANAGIEKKSTSFEL